MKIIEVSELENYLIENKANAIKVSNLEALQKNRSFKNIILISDSISVFGSIEKFIEDLISAFKVKPKKIILTLYAKNGSAFIKKGIISVKTNNIKKQIASASKKKAYVIIDGYFPTIHIDEKEANHYITFVRSTNEQTKNLKAMFCLFTESDLKEGFCNCKFKSI